MRDVCIVSEGAWPARTGGVSTWVQQALLALDGADSAVVSLGSAPWSSGAFDPPRGAREVDVVRSLRRLPDARIYLASGLAAAEAVLAAAPGAMRRVVYVEHGDAVREARHGGLVSESGTFVTRGDRERAAVDVAARRRAVVRAAGGVVGVTTATARRARAQGAAHVRCVPNAVAPVRGAGAPRRRPGYVGRFSKVKGIDRFAALSRACGGVGVAVGMPAGEPWGAPGVTWSLARGCPWRDADFSVLVMPSRLEASPFAALEAEARGVPVLLSDRASLRESALVRRVAWARGRWGRLLDQALRAGVAPELGARLAASRWRHFRHAWRALVERGPTSLGARR